MARDLPLGTLIESEDPTPANVLASKLNRHTFWCGQSGSGKTYALGVMLEQVLLNTRLPLIILDPNSDFTRLNEVQNGVDPAVEAQLRERDIRVFGNTGGEPIKARYVDMPLRSRAAIVNTDPVLHPEDYNLMLRFEEELRSIDEGTLVSYLRASDDPARRRLSMRLENLGVAEWDLWAWGGKSITDHIDEKPDATVVDLGRFPTATESRAAALAVLDHLWDTREERVGRLIVIDEAHNLCPPDPSSPIEALLTERIVQIAAEGRKYGLWLLLSTQRPSKVHPNALSQCDNLALMRMSSSRDLAELSEVFGYAPESLVNRSPAFVQGQALFAGGFVETPALFQMGARLTREGGSDVHVPLR